jgi:hypothetical protein
VRELTFEELDAELAEQLPARELMFTFINRSFNINQIANANGYNVGSGNVSIHDTGLAVVVTDIGNATGNTAVNVAVPVYVNVP